MEKKKSSLLILLVLVVIVSMYFINTSYAKYKSNVSGNDSVRVAKWVWAINGKDVDLASNKSFTMDLFNNSELLDDDCSAKETDVVSEDKVIAPGTCGKFSISIKNNSEVNAKYSLNLSITNNDNIPILFSKDKSSWGDITTLVKNDTSIAAGATTEEETIYWRWAFETDNGDVKDTTLGISGTANVQVNATLTLEQIN